MMQWQTNLKMMASKERQYLQQLANYKSLLRRLGYTPEISHGVLMAMVEHRHELERKTKPILDTLRSYQDLPPVRLLDTKAISFLMLCCVARGMVLSQLFQGSPCFNWDASPFRAMFP
jgi:hypothetical protein